MKHAWEVIETRYDYLTGEEVVTSARAKIEGVDYFWLNWEKSRSWWEQRSLTYFAQPLPNPIACPSSATLWVLEPRVAAVIGEMEFVEAQEFVGENHTRIADHIGKLWVERTATVEKIIAGTVQPGSKDQGATFTDWFMLFAVVFFPIAFIVAAVVINYQIHH